MFVHYTYSDVPRIGSFFSAPDIYGYYPSLLLAWAEALT